MGTLVTVLFVFALIVITAAVTATAVADACKLGSKRK